MIKYIWYRPFICASAVLLLGGSCRTVRSVSPVKATVPEVTQPAPERLTPTLNWQLKHTQLDLHFDMAQRQARGQALLEMSPYFYPSDTVVLDAVGMRILSVKTIPEDLLKDYQYDQQQLRLSLHQSLDRSQTLQVAIDYIAQPYSIKEEGTAAIHSNRGLFFINTRAEEPYKPMQVWTQGETQANSKWFPTFDQPNAKTTLDLTLHVPDSLQTLSNGLLHTSVAEAGGMRADRWIQDKPFAPYLAMMAIGRFAVVKDQWQGKEVSYYVPTAYAATAWQIFNHTPEMMQFFSDRLGVPYPWDKYSQVAVYNYVSGAMENVSASLFGSFNLKNDRELADASNDYIVAHELFHQWFGDYVTCASWGQLTVNESFANYSEYLWSAHKYGALAAEEVWLKALNAYLEQARTKDPPLVRYQYHSVGEMFDRVSYHKGGRILHYLRSLMGDDAFFASLQYYLNHHSLGTAEAVDLRRAVEQVSGIDWKWFFDQWYYRGGHPELAIHYTQDEAAGVLRVRVRQLQADSIGLYRLPLKAQLITPSGVQWVDWSVAARKEQEFVYPYVQGVAPVFVPDAGHWMPGALHIENDAPGAVLQILQQSNSYITKYNALKSLWTPDRTIGTADRIRVLQAALKDTIDAVRTYAVQLVDVADKQQQKILVPILEQLARNDGSVTVRVAAIGRLESLANTANVALFEQAIGSSSYLEAGAGLRALYAQNHKLAYDHATALKATDPRSLLLYTVYMVLAQEGRTVDYAYMESAISRHFDKVRATLIPHFGTYLLQSRDMETYTQGLQFIQKVARWSEGENEEVVATALKKLDQELDKYISLYTDKELVAKAKAKKALLHAAD